MRRAYTELHVAVFLFGFTAILGELISLQELSLVWWRMGIASVSLFLLPGIIAKVKLIPLASLLRLLGIGVIVAMHWVTFFGSVKYSNVSVALSCFGSTALFTSILEPLLLKRSFRWYELGLGLLIVPGIYLIHHFTGVYVTGIVLGVVSALLASFFSILNKREVERFDPLPITAMEILGGWLFLCLCLPFYLRFYPGASMQPQEWDWLYLLLLALLCTTLAYTLAVRSLRQLSAFTSNLTINLEPIYGMLLAVILFQEQKGLNLGFYAGASIILLAVVLHPLLQRLFEKSPNIQKGK